MDSLSTKKTRKKASAARGPPQTRERHCPRYASRATRSTLTRPGTRPGARQDAPLLILFGMSRSLTRLPLRSLMNRNVRDLFTE